MKKIAYFLLLTLLCFGSVGSVQPELKIYISHLENGLKKIKSSHSKEIFDLLVRVRQKELENLDKYQVITAQDSLFFAYQVIAKELYQKLHGNNPHDFEFLRYPNAALSKSCEEFFSQFPALKNSEKAKPFVDLAPEISRQLLSVSFAMESSTPADSALFVFLFGKGIAERLNATSKFSEHVAELFETAGVDATAYGPYLNRLIEAAPKTEEGIINQIFLPKESIENYLYLSLPGGFLDRQNIHEALDRFQKVRLTPSFDVEQNFQARLIVGTLFDGNVILYRYSLIPEHQQEAYRQFVKEVIDLILQKSSDALSLAV